MISSRALVVTFLVFLFFLIIVIRLGIIMLLPQEYSIYEILSFPLGFLFALNLYVTISKPIDIKKIQQILKSKEQNKYYEISILYSYYLKKKYVRIVLSLILAIITLSIICFAVDLISVIPYITFFLFTYCSLLMGRYYIINHRIQNGYWCTNEAEFKELLKFILNNSSKIDFHDDQGNLREAFCEEVVSLCEYELPPNVEGAIL